MYLKELENKISELEKRIQKLENHNSHEDDEKLKMRMYSRIDGDRHE